MSVERTLPPQLSRLLLAEREACDRYERLQRLGGDPAVLAGAMAICQEAKAAVQRFRKEHPEN